MSRDIPIIFSDSMVRAQLDGRKNMTRRLLYTRRTSKDDMTPVRGNMLAGHRPPVPSEIGEYYRLTTWHTVKPGDRLWVRESVQAVVDPEEFDAIKYLADGAVVRSTADTREEADRYADQLYGYRGRKNAPDKMTGVAVPSIHMPRWASRLTWVITATKIERLQDISERDVRSEGVEVRNFALFGSDGPQRQKIAARHFEDLWSSLHGQQSWDANPEVVALTATIHQCNIDKL